jgi:hypothetical protein
MTNHERLAATARHFNPQNHELVQFGGGNDHDEFI